MNNIRRRVVVFLIFGMSVAIAVTVYAIHSRRQVRHAAEASPVVPSLGREHAATLKNRPHMIFRNTALGPGYGCLAVVSLDDPNQARVLTALSCDRVYATQNTGIALQASRGVFTSYKAVTFDEDFNPKTTFELAGVPSRTRLSRDGNYAASTVFVSGDSYNSTGFSTRTKVYDLRSGTMVGDLEEFPAMRNGKPYKKVNFNYWGVTFIPGTDEFYATLGTSSTFHLVKGSISDRKIEVVRDEVECPSLSPDGSRVAYKWRTKVDGRLIWRLRVFNLKTKEEVTLNEPRSVDDQVEWLDNSRILYALPRSQAGSGSSDIWLAQADGKGTPTIFVSDGFSPSVIRP